MTSRERTLLGILCAFGVVAVVGGGYALLYKPIQDKKQQARGAEAEAEELEGKALDLDTNVKGKLAARPGEPPPLPLAEARRRSLPANKEQAQRQYQNLLDYLVRDVARAVVVKVDVKEVTDARGVPMLPAAEKDKKSTQPAYTRFVGEVEFDKADMWGVRDFLAAYYELDLLHRITELSIKPKDEAGKSGRNDLHVRLVTEALMVEGGGKNERRPLLWVSPGFAAVGGMPGYDAVSVLREPKFGRQPALARPAEAYALLALKDPFHGEPTAPFKFDKVAAVNKVVGDRIDPVPVVFVKPAPGADLPPAHRMAVTVTTGGKLLPPGSVKTRPYAGAKSRAGVVPPPPGSFELVITPPKGATGTDTIRVRAEARDGRFAETEVKVSIVGPSPLTVEPLKDIAIKPGEAVPPVKLGYKGDNAIRGKITFTATADGRLFRDDGGEDEAKRVAVGEDGTLTLSPVEGEFTPSTVTVVATAENGDRARTTFKVSVEAPPKPPKPDVSDAIRLVIASTRSDGTATATIKDSFKPLVYTIDAGPDGVRVRKWEFFGPIQKEDRSYRIEDQTNRGKQLYIFDDDLSATVRTFKVLAIDNGGLTLQDLAPPTTKASPLVGKAKTEPAAAVVGLPGSAALRVPPRAVYRWPTGKSLAALVRLSPEEAQKAIARADAEGPVAAAADTQP